MRVRSGTREQRGVWCLAPFGTKKGRKSRHRPTPSTTLLAVCTLKLADSLRGWSESGILLWANSFDATLSQPHREKFKIKIFFLLYSSLQSPFWYRGLALVMTKKNRSASRQSTISARRR